MPSRSNSARNKSAKRCSSVVNSGKTDGATWAVEEFDVVVVEDDDVPNMVVSAR
jgi:hypothetical protein